MEIRTFTEADRPALRALFCRAGEGAGLMEAWFARLHATGTAGSYLQTLVENARAARFFARMGFVPHGPTPPVPGLRYEGRRVHQLTMVRPGP